MENKKATTSIYVRQFINVKDSNVKFNSLQELIYEGQVTMYYFVYTKPDEDGYHISTRISKLDLYNKVITTVDGRKFKILNEVAVDPRKKEYKIG